MVKRFGELLADARIGKGLSLRKLGQFTKMQPSMLSEIEHGRRLPPSDEHRIEHLAHVLGLEPGILIDAAKLARSIKRPQFMEKLDQDLAWSLCRATENVTEEKLNEAIKSMLEKLSE